MRPGLRPAVPLAAVETEAGYTTLRILSLTGFRNHGALRLDLSGGPVVLAGENGAGKTNILEAVSLLTPGRGLRGARTEALFQMRDGVRIAPQWAVAAQVNGVFGPVDLGTGCEARLDDEVKPGSLRRKVRVNGATAPSQSALAEHLAAVWVTPAMNQLFLDGGGARRRFLDRLVYAVDPAHAGRVTAYEKALRDRSKLLKESGPHGADQAWLDALEAQIAERGVAVTAARLDLTARLARVAAIGFGPFPGAEVSLEGVVEDWLVQGAALTAEDAFRATLAEGRVLDAQSGGAAVGPHRSDLKVRHLAKGAPAEHCSTGEQKALLLALVLAHARLLTAETGAAPILLLDEVAAHLDGGKRAALFEAVLAHGAQTWMTGTDASVFDPLDAAADRFRVENAAVTPA